MAELRLDVLRHGECEGGEIFRGHNDAALSAEGWQTMQAAVTQYSGRWSRIISSPLSRCAAFAENLAAKERLTLSTEPGFTEISFGDWEGRPIATIWREQAELMAAWRNNPYEHTPPSGETFSDFSARVDTALQGLLHRYSGERLLLVTHGGVIRHLLVRALKLEPHGLSGLQVPYGCMAQLIVNAKGLQVIEGERYSYADV